MFYEITFYLLVPAWEEVFLRRYRRKSSTRSGHYFGRWAIVFFSVKVSRKCRSRCVSVSEWPAIAALALTHAMLSHWSSSYAHTALYYLCSPWNRWSQGVHSPAVHKQFCVRWLWSDIIICFTCFVLYIKHDFRESFSRINGFLDAVGFRLSMVMIVIYV